MKPLLVVLLLLFSGSSLADDMRPASLTLTATNATEISVAWKIPIRNGSRQSLAVRFSDDSEQVGQMKSYTQNNAALQYWTISRQHGLIGLKVSIDGLEGVTGDVLLRIVDINKNAQTVVLNTDKTFYIIQQQDALTAFETAITYVELGIEHILVGLDHLFFVACLVYISRTRKKLLLTITGFTLAHSITLILAATDTFTVPIPPVEAVIALSIVFLAWEIASNRKNSLSHRYPVLVSSSFGFLHGFGFASVLAEIGLPETEKVLALLCFNIGVEIGQVLFVVGLFLLFWLTTLVLKSITAEKLRIPTSYLCGSIACVWMIERLATF